VPFFDIQGEMPGEGRVTSALSAAGNALFFAALGGVTYFGYYTFRYTTPEMEELIRQRKQPDQAFPGSSVRLLNLHPALYVICPAMLVLSSEELSVL